MLNMVDPSGLKQNKTIWVPISVVEVWENSEICVGMEVQCDDTYTVQRIAYILWFV
jgi:hypothetical protein